MSNNNFIDYVKIHCQSGKGGAGSRHFRREKYITKGGPDGGDGGRGGHVIVKGNKQMWTLLHLKHKRHVKAGHGEGGSKNTSSGAEGEDVFVEVPLGTVAKDAETGEVLFEITEDGEEQILVKGGRGPAFRALKEEIWPTVSSPTSSRTCPEVWTVSSK